MFGAGASHDYRNRKPVLLLDLDGTVFPTDLVDDQIVLAGLRGAGVDDPRATQAFRGVKDRLYDAKKYYLYSATDAELERVLRATAEGCARKLGADACRAGLAALRAALADAKKVRLFSGYIEVLRDLRDHGVAIYIVTAGREREQLAKVAGLGLSDIVPPGRVLVSEGDYRRGRAKDTRFHARVIASVHRDPERPGPQMKLVRAAIREARSRLATTPYTFYMVGDHPRIDVENFLRLVPEDTTALRAIRVRRGKWRTRVPASPEHMAVENLNHARLIVYSNHGIQSTVFPPGV